MLFLTAVTLGTSAAMLRSAFSMALVAVLVIVAFAAAAVAGPVSITDLAIALLGYNAGIFAAVAGALALSRSLQRA